MNTLFPELENHYIGITETYEPALDFSWIDNLQIGNIIITKCLSDEMIKMLLKYKDKCILHLVCTGYGSSVLEPNVPTVQWNKEQLLKLLEQGFPLRQVILRISPIIPTKEGIDKVIYVLDTFKDIDIKRIRFSTLNVYNHIKPRFYTYNISLPYDTYSCPEYMRTNLLESLSNYYNITDVDEFNLDCCAEIDLNENKIKKVGCVSQRDLEILGIEDKVNLFGIGKQRKTCLCPNNKKQIIKRQPGRCDHACLYCYWKS